jgi:hypothetical protein
MSGAMPPLHLYTFNTGTGTTLPPFPYLVDLYTGHNIFQ